MANLGAHREQDIRIMPPRSNERRGEVRGRTDEPGAQAA